MSDVMLLGVLRMPYDLFWSDKPLSRMQHNSRRLQAADELESRADEIQQLTAKVKEQALQLEITEASNKHLHTAIEGKNLKIEALERERLEDLEKAHYAGQSFAGCPSPSTSGAIEYLFSINKGE